jgi:hypothetical protein
LRLRGTARKSAPATGSRKGSKGKPVTSMWLNPALPPQL